MRKRLTIIATVVVVLLTGASIGYADQFDWQPCDQIDYRVISDYAGFRATEGEDSVIIIGACGSEELPSVFEIRVPRSEVRELIKALRPFKVMRVP